MAAHDTDQEYFEASVNSVLSQSYENYEFIIVDDGLSKDNSAYLQTIGDRRLVVIVNEENIGQSRSVNKALEIARGLYVARMDADDIARRDRLELQLRFMEEHPKLIACFGCAKIIGSDVIIPRLYPSFDAWRIGMLFTCEAVHPTMFVDARAFREHGIRYDENQLYAQDYLLWARLMECGEIGSIPVIVLDYRVHPGQISSKKMSEQNKYASRARAAMFALRGFALSSEEMAVVEAIVQEGQRCRTKNFSKQFRRLIKRASDELPRSTARRFAKEANLRVIQACITRLKQNKTISRPLFSLFLKSMFDIRNCIYAVAAKRYSSRLKRRMR